MPKKESIKNNEPSENEENVTVVTPEVCVDHDEKAYFINVELPGVDKKHVNLTVGEQSFCVEASRDDIFYLGCFSLAHPVDEDKTKAKFENGLLSIEVPLKGQLKGKRVKIE